MHYLAAILTIIFVCLKLGIGAETVVMTWSWWLVFSPFLISLGLSLFILAVFGIIAVLALRVDRR